VSFVGVALVAAGTSGGVRASVGGILLALVTTLSFAAYSVAIVPAMRRHSPLVVNAASCMVGGLLLCLVSLPWLARQTCQRLRLPGSRFCIAALARS
jgi:drug/metabolite transporter (DMT)-like permease